MAGAGRRILRKLFRALGFGVLGFLVLLAVAFFAAGPPVPLPATVTDDADLPRMEVAGVTLHARAEGPEDAPVIVVLHGGPGGDHRSLLPLAGLADSHRVVFYDQRGAGLSERVPDAALTFEAHLDELDALVDAVSPAAPVVLIGHSWGAILATAYLGVAPRRVADAVLIEPGFLNAAGMAEWQARADGLIGDMTRSVSGIWLVTKSVLQSLRLDGPDADGQGDYVTGRMVAAFANHPENPYHCPGAAYDAPSWRFGARSQSAVPASAGPGALDAIAAGAGGWDGRALFLTGACDDWIGADLQRRHMAYFRDARLVDIADAGHDVVHDRPDAALAAIRAFLNGG